MDRPPVELDLVSYDPDMVSEGGLRGEIRPTVIGAVSAERCQQGKWRVNEQAWIIQV